MRSDQDPILMRLFAAQDVALPANEFMNRLVLQLERGQRKLRVQLIIAALAFLIVAALAAPGIIQLVGETGALVADLLRSLGSILQSPITLLVGGSLAVGLLPVVFVWRAWRH